MSHTLGVDIGTFESKGVLVDAQGGVVATAVRPHRMLVPQPGWAEHRAEEDWWGDFVRIIREILAESGVEPRDIACGGDERHRAVHAAGGRGGRAADERRALRGGHARGCADRGADGADRGGRDPRGAAATR